MDPITQQLHSFLVYAGINAEAMSPQMEHYMEHLVALLEPRDEEALTDYYGLFGTERRSLQEIAQRLGTSQEDALEHIDLCVRRLAVTPEWQMLKQIRKK